MIGVQQITAIVLAYLVTGIPVGAAMLAGRMSPMYRVPTSSLLRWWGWAALIFILSAVVWSRL